MTKLYTEEECRRQARSYIEDYKLQQPNQIEDMILFNNPEIEDEIEILENEIKELQQKRDDLREKLLITQLAGLGE